MSWIGWQINDLSHNHTERSLYGSQYGKEGIESHKQRDTEDQNESRIVALLLLILDDQVIRRLHSLRPFTVLS